MADLTPEIASEVLAACQAGAEEAAEAVSRALDGEFAVAPGEAGTLNVEELPEGFDGPGLAIVFKFGESGAAAVIPEASGLLPDWYSAPDATGESKLSTLAQELSMLLFPETLMADDFKAAKVAQVGEAVARGEPGEGAALVPLALTSGEKQGTLSLVWPLGKADAVLEAAEPDAAEAAEQETTEPETTEAAAPSNAEPRDAAPPADEQGPPEGTSTESLNVLPRYSRSLLRIKVPTIVNLATKKQSISEILELGPGSIIKFEKSCEELLELTVGNCSIGEGEAVKVGDKFGLRISTITLPNERFEKVVPRR